MNNNDRDLDYRLRVVPLSLSPSCMTQKKIARKKWLCEILSLNYALLSQCKNMIGLYNNMVFTFKIRVTSCRNALSRSLKIEKQIKTLEWRLTGHDVLVILPTGYGKSFKNIYEVFCLAKLFASNLNANIKHLSGIF